MKKVLVCALAVFFLMASCSTAFAATTTTTTTYVNGDTTKMTVTTTIYGATEGAMYTFLVTDGAKTATNVKAADQITAENGTVTFEYTGNTTDVVNYIAYSGNNVDSALAEDDTLTRTVNITYAGGEVADTTLILPAYVSDATTIPFKVYVPYNKKIASVKAGETNLGYTNGVITDTDFADGDTLIVTLAAAETNVVDGNSAVGKTFWRMNGNEVLTVFAKITSLVPGTEFGVQISVDGGEWKTYKANGCGEDGSFAVQFINELANGNMANADFTGKSVKARVYFGNEVTDEFDVEYVPYEG